MIKSKYKDVVDDLMENNILTENEYKRICDKNYQMTSRRQKIFEDENFGYNLLRIYKHISKLLEPSANFLQKLEQIFIGIPFSLISFLFKYRK